MPARAGASEAAAQSPAARDSVSAWSLVGFAGMAPHNDTPMVTAQAEYAPLHWLRASLQLRSAFRDGPDGASHSVAPGVELVYGAGSGLALFAGAA